MSEITGNILPQNLDIWQNTLGWQPTELQLADFERLYQKVLLANQQFNLTRITEPQEFWEKHLWDSLAGIFKMPERQWQKTTVIDIGTGAGFPGIPMAIFQPEWLVTLLDSTQKKINFLNDLTQELGLKNTQTLLGRAEAIVKNKNKIQGYNLALIRAVGNASLCAKYSLPLLKLGGMAVLYRGNWSEAENEVFSGVVEQLGGKVKKIESFATPISQSVRHCIYLEKVR